MKQKITLVLENDYFVREFDKKNPNWAKEVAYNHLFLQAQQNYFNELLNREGFVFLNEVLYCLGFDRTPAGAITGWLKKGSGDGFIDFGIDGMDVDNPTAPIELTFNVDGVIFTEI